MLKTLPLAAIPFSLFSLSPLAAYHNIETIEIKSRQVNLVGDAISAAEGVVGQQEIELRPLNRTGDVLEFVPGMVATQHSGSGKANQYFLRGFNLDHGTDFATMVDGMPVNMRTHGHGQGYTDLNFIIPETIQSLRYQKGVYYAQVGDFSGAGSAQLQTMSKAPAPMAEVTLGEYNYRRAVSVVNFTDSVGHWLVAGEQQFYDGPWSDINEDIDKTNGLIKWSSELGEGNFSVTFMSYDNSWNSADQIPSRAVSSGLIDKLGSIDDTVGGESSRYSLSADWSSDRWQVSAYAISYDLKLWSNFTYFLDNPEQGDQFEQVDERIIYGGQAAYTFSHSLFGTPSVTEFGVQARVDDIDEVGLYATRARTRLGTTRSDEVEQSSLSSYVQNEIQWTSAFRSVIGARTDFFDFSVRDRAGINRFGVDLSSNSGDASDDITSFKGSLIYTLSPEWEIYGSAGQGLHSNDARGTTIQVDPVSGDAVDQVNPLVRTTGFETGLRAFYDETLNASVSLWQLELDSELLFVGDAGNTEASRQSKRRGIELTAYYYFAPEWSLDVEYAFTDAQFTENDAAGDEIPGAIEHVLQAGISADLDNGWFGSLRMRYFGSRPLTEDGSVSSPSSMLFNAQGGKTWRNWQFTVSVLNLTDSDDHDIDYYYASRLQGEPSEGVEDIHYHIFEPRTVRIAARYRF